MKSLRFQKEKQKNDKNEQKRSKKTGLQYFEIFDQFWIFH